MNCHKALFAVVLLAIGVASGCAPTIKVVKEETIQNTIAKESRGKGYEEGFAQGKALGRKEAMEEYSQNLNDLKDYVLYKVMQEEDLIEPPRVQRIYVGGVNSGTSYAPARVEYVIVQGARFKDPGMSAFLKDNEWQWILLKEFGDTAEAMQAAARVQKSSLQDGVDVINAKSGGKALIVKVRKANIASAMAHYKGQFASCSLAN